MQQIKYEAGQTVRIHNKEWFRINKINGRYTLKGRYEYDDKMIKEIAGRWAKILQVHEDLGLYDITIGHRIYQVEPLLFNDRRKYWE